MILLPDKRGVSLLITIGICSLIIILAVGVSKIIVGQLKATGNSQAANAAYYAAEAGMEIALLRLKDQPIGAQLAGTFSLPIEDDTGKTGRVAQVSYRVISDGEELWRANGAYDNVGRNVFTVPSPWTGNAAALPCNPDNPPVINKDTPSSDELKNSALEHPCNWDKIAFGQTVNIPLYRLDKDNKPVNPADSGGLNSLVLKIRTPCTGGVLDEKDFKCKDSKDAEARPKLAVDSSNLEKEAATDATVVNWQISATDQGGATVTLLAEDGRGKYKPQNKPEILIRNSTINSEITESKINSGSASMGASKYVILTDVGVCSFGRGNDSSKCGGKDVYDYKGGLLDFLKGQAQKNPPLEPRDAKAWSNIPKNQPMLKLTVIHPLVDDQKQKIPYLEYQLVTDRALAATSQTIEAAAEVNGFRQALRSRRPVGGSVLEFTVHN